MRVLAVLSLALAPVATWAQDSASPTGGYTPVAPSVPTVSAKVIWPAASSDKWAHNGTAYVQYSLPDLVDPRSLRYVLQNGNSALLKTGNANADELKPYFTYLRMMRSTAQPGVRGTYWVKWVPAYGVDPKDVQPGTGYRVGVAYKRLGNVSFEFTWSEEFEVKSDGVDELPASVSAYPPEATASTWMPPSGPGPTLVATADGGRRARPAAATAAVACVLGLTMMIL